MNITKIAAAAAALLTLTSAGAALAQSDTGSGTITILRPVTVTKDADLEFGTVTRPPSGTANVTIAAATGARTVGAGIVEVGATNQQAQFTIDGEGGQSVSITIDASFLMSQGGDDLTVTTNNDLAGGLTTQTLSNTLGSAGDLVVQVGGEVTLADTTTTGTYTGTFTVAAAYN
jgi:hypothetical protein